MKYDAYGRPIGAAQNPRSGYGYAEPQGTHGQHGQAPNYSDAAYVTPDNIQARINMPQLADMGGQGQIPWVRFPFFPTAPFYSTDPKVGTQTRFYGATLLYTDTDYTVNQESIRIVQFDIPARVIAINAAVVQYDAGNALLPTAFSGMNPQDAMLFRMEYTTGDRLHTAARLGSTVCGTMDSPGELGGTGYTVDQGATLILGITPLAVRLRVDITLHCLEIRGPSNFYRG